MLTLIKRLSPDIQAETKPIILALTATERTRTRHRFETQNGEVFLLRLPRGTILQDGDLLEAETGEIVEIKAKAEAILTVFAPTPLDLLKAAYHLGNRHVALEIKPQYLRLSPDPVLEEMLKQLGLEIKTETAPFNPEMGAYKHGH